MLGSPYRPCQILLLWCITVFFSSASTLFSETFKKHNWRSLFKLRLPRRLRERFRKSEEFAGTEKSFHCIVLIDFLRVYSIFFQRRHPLQTFRKRIEIPFRPMAEMQFTGLSDKFITKQREVVRVGSEEDEGNVGSNRESMLRTSTFLGFLENSLPYGTNYR